MAVYLTFVFVLRLIWEIAVATPDKRREALRRSLLSVFAIGVSALVTMVQWLPTRDLVAQSERASPSYERSIELSLPLTELIDAIFPESTNLPGLNPGTEVFYWGIGALLLAGMCLPVVRLRGPGGFYILLAVVALFMALGGNTAAHRIAYYLIPGVAWFRAPSRWMVVVTLAVALAAGRGFDAITRDRILTSTKIVRGYGLVFGAFFFLALLLLLLLVVQRFLLSGAPASEMAGLTQQLGFVLVCLSLVAVLFTLYTMGKLPAAALGLIFVLVIFWDLLTAHGSREIEPGPGRYVWDENIETILNDPNAGRVKIRFGFEGADRRQYNAHVFGFREMDGESPYKPRDYLLWRPLTRLEDPFRINHRFLDLCECEYILADNINPGGAWVHASEHRWQNPEISPSPKWYNVSLTLAPDTVLRLLNAQSFPSDRIALTSTPGPEELADSTWRIPGYDTKISVPLLVLSVSQAGLRHQAAIILDGADHAKNGRGYNIVVVDPETSEVVGSEVFDTLSDYVDPGIVKDDAPENARMSRFIQDVPEGHVVIAAVREEGTNILQENAVKALQSCGSGLDLRKKPHLAHAMIGVKGSPSGTAMEVLGATEGLIMTMPDSEWIQTPRLPPIDVKWNFAYLNAYSIWETLSSVPGPFSRIVSHRIGDSRVSIHIPVVVFSSPKDDTLPPDVERDRAGIFVGGKDWSPNQRGYNLAAFDPMNGEILAVGAFDTSLDWNAEAGVVVPGTPENTRMIHFLESVPDRSLVIGAVRDEGCNILQPETVDALRGVGCSLDLRKRFRWSHAFVGIKGASPGTALEIASTTHVIIHTTVTNSQWPGLNTDIPTLNVHRRVELSRQDIPVLMSSADAIAECSPVESDDARRADDARPGVELLGGRSAGKARDEASLPQKASFPTAEETDLREKDRGSKWFLRRLSPEEFEIVGSATEDGILFVSEFFDPDWRTYLDGREVATVRTMRFFRGVRVPPGSHTIRMVYSPRSFVRGAALTFVGLLVWIGWGIGLLLDRKRTQESGAVTHG